jgi:signal transduction histidine kinase/CheY-like chemotaxis protein
MRTKPNHFATVFLDITERKQAEEKTLRHAKLLAGMSRVFQEAITCESEEELGIVCLSVAGELTGSTIGFIGETRADGQLYDITISNPGWDLCKIKDKAGHPGSVGTFKIHGLYGYVLEHGTSLLSNDPVSHPVSIGLPKGHPPLTAFLGVPLVERGKTIGLVAVGNREGGYTVEHQEILEALAPAIVQALLRKRAENEIRKSRDGLERRVQERTAELAHAYDSLQKETQDRQRIEQQLRQSQKMEALGTLTGGIAHDFNNILAAIIGFTELIQDHVPTESREARHAARVLAAGIRGRELVKQMLTFSRKTEQEKKPLQLSGIVEETMTFLRASTPTTISIKIDVRSPGLIFADPTQMRQVLTNLYANASYAMSEKGGVLDIELSDHSISPSSGDPPAGYVRLIVRDTGTGMSADVMDRIFDPFFTTKKVGEGTGLGLSVVHGIVEQHDGYITAMSEPGKGSTFTVYLPRITGAPETDAVSDDEIPTGSERILFVDDEEALVEMGEELLAELGYEVICRTSSEDALALLKKDTSRFDLVITDQTMPDITGFDLARKILAIRPDMPIILCTGFSNQIDAETAKQARIKAFVMKPLVKQEIAKTVREVLDGQTR